LQKVQVPRKKKLEEEIRGKELVEAQAKIQMLEQQLAEV
jgi:hypothetical protein